MGKSRMAANRPLFGDLDILPLETREEILSYCSLPVLGVFARVSHQAEEASAFVRLLPGVVAAAPESYQQVDETRLAAIAILKKYPELLFREAIVTYHFGRKIKASPYQLFLGAGDVWALKQVHEAIIPNIENGEAHAQAQFQAQFPNCQWPPAPDMSEAALYDDRNKEQIEQVIAQLKKIVEKITADPCTHGRATLDETRQAVAELRRIFTPKEREIIETGLHFPLGIMHEIGKVYDAQWEPWSVDQLSFYSREVIGSAEAALTAVDGQCCKNGLANLNMDKGPDRRDGLFCRHPKGTPQSLSPLVGKLGQTMFVDPYDGNSCFPSSTRGAFDWYNKNGAGGDWTGSGWGGVRRPGAGDGAFGGGGGGRFGKFMSSKNRELIEIMQRVAMRASHQTPSRQLRCTLL